MGDEHFSSLLQSEAQAPTSNRCFQPAAALGGAFNLNKNWRCAAPQGHFPLGSLLMATTAAALIHGRTETHFCVERRRTTIYLIDFPRYERTQEDLLPLLWP